MGNWLDDEKRRAEQEYARAILEFARRRKRLFQRLAQEEPKKGARKDEV